MTSKPMSFSKVGASNPATQAGTPKTTKQVVRPGLLSEYRAIKATIEAEQHAKEYRKLVKKDRAIKSVLQAEGK